MITIGTIAAALMVHQRSVRQLLAEVNPDIEVYLEDESEPVSRENIADLIATRGNDRASRVMARLLREDTEDASQTTDVLVRGIDAELYRQLRERTISQSPSAAAVLRQAVNEGIRGWLRGNRAGAVDR